METTHILSENEQLLKEAPVRKLFVRYALPGVVGLLFYGIQTLIDAIVVGNFLGADALAGINLVLPCYTAFSVVTIMLGIGSQTVINIGLGEQQYQKAKDAMTTGFLGVLALGILVPLILYPLSKDVATLLGANDRLVGYSSDYIRGLVPFLPTVAVMFYSDYMLKAVGYPRVAMIIMSATVVLNAVLSILLVTVFEKGTFGVGFATGLSFSIGAIASGIILFNRKRKISMLSGKFHKGLFWRMLYNGSSEGVTELSAGISIMIMNLTLMHYASAEGVAAFTAINYTYFLGITVFLGISDGIIPIISYNYGAGAKKRVANILKLALKVNLTIGIVLFGALFLFGEHIITLFFRGGEDRVMDIAVHGAKLYSFSFLFCGINILSSSFFTAMADAKTSIIISLLRGLVFIALGLMILPPLLGIDGIWLTTPVSELLTVIVAILLVYRYAKRAA